MPPCTCNSDAESSDLSNEPHKERAPTAPHRQMLVDFHQRLSCTHDALKEAPKLTTKNWYAWNPHFWGILSNWPTAMKHLDGTANIHKLITDINEHWAKAELMDHRAGDLKTAQANLADGEVKNKEAYCWDLGATDHS
ncbi:hypothetical protein NDA15_005877 [Ustilago hordei]|nr:hypothetical protein NDA15_005877 [Ustilago hordei]